MRSRLTRFLPISMICVVLIGLMISSATAQSGAETISLPVAFVQNAGQWQQDALYGGLTRPIRFFHDRIVWLKQRSSDILELPKLDTPVNDNDEIGCVRFLNPSPYMTVRELAGSDGPARLYVGPDSAIWRTDSKILRGIEYHNVWDSVDVIYRGVEGGVIQTVRLRPGARSSQVALSTTEPRNMLGDATCLQTAAALYKQTVRLPMNVVPDTTEFSTYIGGTEDDCVFSVRVHSDGSIYVAGLTNSIDFPFTGPRYSRDAYVLRLGCDGRTIMFCSVYAALRAKATGETRGTSFVVMALKRNGHPVLACLTQCSRFPTFPFPLTANALESNPDGADAYSLLVDFDEDGVLSYASLFGVGNGDYTCIKSIVLDTKDNVLLAGEYCWTTSKMKFRYLTAGTVGGSNYPVSGRYLVKLSSSMDSLMWGTLISGSNLIFSVGIDTADNPIITGQIISDSITCVNAFQPQPGPGFVQKLTPDAKSYIFSSYFGGPNIQEYVVDNTSDDICVGHDGNIYLIGSTNSSEFPVIGSTRHYSGGYDGYLTVVSSDGRLLRSILLGCTEGEGIYNADVDLMGNVYLFGTTYSDYFPLASPWFERADTGAVPKYATAFLSVLSASLDSLLFSTHWPINVDNSGVANALSSFHFLDISSSGYVHFGGTCRWPNQTFHGLRDTMFCPSSDSCIDGFLTRMYLPFSGRCFIGGHLTGSDTLRFETTYGILHGSEFPITADVRNTSLSDTAWDVSATAILPAGVMLDPPGQTLSLSRPGPLYPGAKCSFVWTVRIDNHDPATRSYHFPITIYQGSAISSSCERPFLRGAIDVPVHRYTSPIPSFDCSLITLDSLRIDTVEDSLVGNPVPVQCKIRNTGAAGVFVRELILRLSGQSTQFPLGMFQPVGDSIRQGGMLGPNEEITVSWLVHVSNWRTARILDMQVMIIDTFGVALPGCSGSIQIPALQGVNCWLSAEDTIQYTPSGYTPNPLSVDLRLTSRLDTTIANIEATLDLTHAANLRPIAGETLLHYAAPIPARDATSLRWRLEVIPDPPADEIDTIVVNYAAPSWAASRSCTTFVRIIPPQTSVTCALTVPDVTVSQNGCFAPDTVSLKLTVYNAGDTPSPFGKASLSLTLDSAQCLDPFAQYIPALSPKQNYTLLWRLIPRTSAFNRAVEISVTVADTIGKSFADCRTTLELPRVYPSVLCLLTAADTLRYLRQIDGYIPDPSSIQYTAYNLVDTASTVSAVLALDEAQYLGLAPSETGIFLPVIVPPHGTTNNVFHITVSRAPVAISNEDVRVTTTAQFGDMPIEQECHKTITIEARPKILSAECYTAGHDTSWVDHGNEEIIPNPLQMRLGIVNTGNEPLADCEAAIVVPKGYILSKQVDSIQRLSIIAPGDTGRMEWLIEVNILTPVLGESEIIWVWNCGQLSGSCSRKATLVDKAPSGITLSPWRLRFKAQRNGPTPKEQQVSVWTGDNAPFNWRAESNAWWLDTTPNLFSGSKVIQIGPTTTALADSIYEGRVSIVTSEFARPTPIEVTYEISTPTVVEVPSHYSNRTMYCIPNPVRQGGVLQVFYRIAEPGMIRLSLMDTFGRELLSRHEVHHGTGVKSMLFSIPALMSTGTYFVLLQGSSERVIQGVVVIK